MHSAIGLITSHIKKCMRSIIRMVKMHVKMHTFHQRTVRSHVQMHRFYHTGGQVACKIHVFYMPDRHIAYKSAQTRAHVSVPPWHPSAAKRQKGRVVQGDGLRFGVGWGGGVRVVQKDRFVQGDGLGFGGGGGGLGGGVRVG